MEGSQNCTEDMIHFSLNCVLSLNHAVAAQVVVWKHYIFKACWFTGQLICSTFLCSQFSVFLI